MIIVRSPLRITLGGGGTDLPSYYRKHGGFCVSAAIDKYVYVAVTRPFLPGIYLKYSEHEQVRHPEDIGHPIFREALKNSGLTQIEITTLADIPAGTGLGSSGSFAAGLIRALYAYQRQPINLEYLASLAADLEMRASVAGKQDPYIAAYGGLAAMNFSEDHDVQIGPLGESQETLHSLEENLLLFFTGFSRSASDLLQDQDKRSFQGDAPMIANLDEVKALGLAAADALRKGDLRWFARLLDEQWDLKKRRSDGMSNEQIDQWYTLGKNSGALGGKLVGAGGGGFLMFYAEDRSRLRAAMASLGLEEVRFRFDFEGAKVIMS